MIKTVTRKSMLIRSSGRSTDYISPSFGHGCLYNCSYCYMKRHKDVGLDVADLRSTLQILTEINNHAYFTTVQKPNQTHDKYITYDISCNEDFALHAKHHHWERIFKYFVDSDVAMGSFATKYVNKKLLKFNPEKKIRVRFSLMPQELADKLEPRTSSIQKRLEAINDFISAGYDVHVNFSPVVYTDNWLELYKELFNQLNSAVAPRNKPRVKAEVIFLTHNEKKHKDNLKNKLDGEDLLWNPDIQETKISEYGGKNIRYKYNLKANFIKDWRKVHNEIVPWNTIRYIF